MAAMATDTPLNPLSFPDKAQSLADTSALAEKPVNGYASINNNCTKREDSGLTSVSDATHYDALFDDSTANKNGMTNGTSTTQEDASASPQKVVAAEDATAAPVEHVEGGISGVAAFLPASTNHDAIPPATEPPATMTEPAPVEPTTSDARDEPMLPADPAKAVVDAEGPLPGEPSLAPVKESAPQKDATSPPADKMDTTEDAPAASSPGNAEAEALLDKPDVPMESVEPQVTPAVSSVVTTIPPPAEEAKPSAQQEQVTTGQVRQREEDDEVEPAPKRAKTESGDDEAATSAPVTSAPSANAEAAPAADTSAPATSVAAAPTQTPRAPLPDIPSIDSNPITLTQEKFLLEQIRKAKKTKSALAFLVPVDWAHLNIPTYPDVVKHPMDLKTMEEKLKAHEYETADAMMKDFQQMVQNSILFNGEQHPIAQAGQSLRAYFIKCVSLLPKGEAAKTVDQKPKKVEPAPPKVARPARQATIPVAKSPATEKPAGFLNEHGMPIIRRDSSAQNDRPKREIHPPKRDLPASSSRPKKKKHQLELKFCEQVVAELHKKKYYGFSYAFLNPVDPVALNIPNYLRIIKKPMDFGTIQTNLKNGHYQSAKECYADCKLVFANCYKFNPPSDGVYEMGQKLEAVFDAEWAKKDTWIANNLPPSEPASEDEEEVEEEPEEEEDPNMRRMQEIQAQIAALSAEAMQLTTGPRKASPKAPAKTKIAKTAAKPKAAKQAATASAPAPKAAKPKKAPKTKRLTLDQKREVSDGIANLDEVKMRKAVQIIRNGVPHLANVQDDELELDIDEIPDDVLSKLWDFVKTSAPKREREVTPDYMDEDDDDYTQRGGGGAAGGGPRRKNKPMKAQEQEERIKQLQEKLQGGGSSASPVEKAESGEEDSESSEEE